MTQVKLKISLEFNNLTEVEKYALKIYEFCKRPDLGFIPNPFSERNLLDKLLDFYESQAAYDYIEDTVYFYSVSEYPETTKWLEDLEVLESIKHSTLLNELYPLVEETRKSLVNYLNSRYYKYIQNLLAAYKSDNLAKIIYQDFSEESYPHINKENFTHLQTLITMQDNYIWNLPENKSFYVGQLVTHKKFKHKQVQGDIIDGITFNKETIHFKNSDYVLQFNEALPLVVKIPLEKLYPKACLDSILKGVDEFNKKYIPWTGCTLSSTFTGNVEGILTLRDEKDFTDEYYFHSAAEAVDIIKQLQKKYHVN